MESTQGAFNGWLDKEIVSIYIYIYLYIDIYTYIQSNVSHKNNEVLPFTTMWMDLYIDA